MHGETLKYYTYIFPSCVQNDPEVRKARTLSHIHGNIQV